MDKVEKQEPKPYAWMPGAMPAVAKLIAEKRRTMGPAHVAECFRRGMAGEPGWFFAREGALAIGTPWADDPAMALFAQQAVKPGQALVFIRQPVQAPAQEVAHGT